MSNFILHTRYTAPENLVELLEGKERAFRFLPNLKGFMVACRRWLKRDHRSEKSLMINPDQIPNIKSSWLLPGLTIEAAVWDQIPSLQINRK